jgi:hypothetical protein
MEGVPPTHPIPATTDPGPTVRDRQIAIVSAVLLVIGMPVGYLPGSTGDTIGLIVLSLVSLALLAGIVFWLVPRERAAPRPQAERTVLILGVLAALSFLLFWTGLPFALGAGAIALGLSLRDSAPAGGQGRATAAVVLGALAILASFVILLVG